MNWKEFFKPNTIKIIITIALLLLTYLYYREGGYFDLYTAGRGWPLPFYYGSNIQPTPPPGGFSPIELKFMPLFFMIDIVFWYIVSIVLMEIYARIRKK